ncbi:putative ubiquitin homeostasis protein [Triangularia verruculosa]|uniref:Ubiquitin homeostasis protein n=1 Tax=Triangularia verruculosa TaxID=2587418 RepID=A0AAN7AS53_9PEZI|nr:putative ubiquitin homeostasis protein [Triangularia verruculosa]
MPDFKLSAQLKGHEADVRAVAFPSANLVVSTSRDRTVRLWRRTAPQPPTFDETITSQGHGYINSVAFLPPSSEWPEGLVISAGYEAIIEVKRPSLTSTDNADRLLVGHGHNVCTLDVSPAGKYLVSGGWDGKAIIWRTDKWEQAAQLAHDGEVKTIWTVLAFDENTIITGSADAHIRIYDTRKVNHTNEVEPTRTLTTNSVVRALCKLPGGLKKHPSGADFASADNDGIIRLWKLDGTEVGELRGHDSFIYSLACLPNGEIVSSGEDRTVRIWRGSECIQTITHPAISVWTVAVCPENGDIVSGASDHTVRVFTRNADRAADPEALAQFEEAVRSSAIPQQQLGSSINKEQLDPYTWLQSNSGQKDGQVKTVLEENGTIGAYQWSRGEQRWVHVGTVVDSTGSTGRKVPYNGQEYDYVFDVDIEEGKPPLKLPYNLSQNPYEAATKFLGDNELPISYLDQVAQFITTNTKGATIGRSSGLSDPYGTEAQSATEQASQPSTKFLPHTDYLALAQAKPEPVLKKLKSLNEKHILAGNKHMAMNPSGLSVVEQVLQVTIGVSAVGKRGKEPPALREAAQTVYNIATQWPYSDRLPALDALRCLVTWPGVATVADPSAGDAVNAALRSALDVESPIQSSVPLTQLAQGVDVSGINVNNVMMALRTVTNLFATIEGRQLMTADATNITTVLGRVTGLGEGVTPIGAENNNVQIALTSAIFNFACLGFNERTTVNFTVISNICEIAAAVISRQSDPEVLFRAVMTLGMVLATGGQAQQVAKALEVGEAIGEAAKKSGEARIKSLAKECYAYLK